MTPYVRPALAQFLPVIVAVSFLGTAGRPGPESDPTVLRFFKLAGRDDISSDEVPWCSAFVSAVFAICGHQGLGNLSARSWLAVGEPTNAPQWGDVAVFWRDSKDGALGHVGLYLWQSQGQVWILGGNQNNSVSIAPFPVARLLGYRKITIANPA